MAELQDRCVTCVCSTVHGRRCIYFVLISAINVAALVVSRVRRFTLYACVIKSFLAGQSGCSTCTCTSVRGSDCVHSIKLTCTTQVSERASTGMFLCNV